MSVRDRDAVGYKEQLTRFLQKLLQWSFYYWFILGGYHRQLGVSEQLWERSLNIFSTKKQYILEVIASNV